MFRRIGEVVVRRRGVVALVWLAVVVVGGVVGGSLMSRLETQFVGADRYESTQVLTRLDELAVTGGEIAVVTDGVAVDDPALTADATAVLDDIRAIDGVVAVVDPWSVPEPGLRSTDGEAGLIVVTIAGGLEDSDEIELAEEITHLAGEIDAPEVNVGGQIIIDEEFREAAERDLQRGEMIALPIAFVAMVFIFGGLRAAFMPLVVAATGVLTAMIVLFVATGVTSVSIFAVNVVTMLGIGLGIDYGLLVVSRFREERAAGRTVDDAVVETVATAGTTVMFSGLTVAVAMAGLFAFGDPMFTSFGIAGAGVVIACMAAAITLLPAALARFGARIRPAKASSADDGGFARLARFVQRRAVPVVVIVGLGLALLAVPFLGAEFRGGDARSLPRSSEAREVALTLAERFPSHGADPVVVVADAPADDPALVAFVDEIAASDLVAAVGLRPGFEGDVTVIDAVPLGESQGEIAQDLVDELRAAAPGFDVQVGGMAAQLMDAGDMISSRLPWALTMIVAATFVLLFLMTGSLAVPAKAVVMNVLSLGASFGALVWIFQDGNLSGILGFDPIGALDLWMPTLIFIFAFGLSMDYEVFLLSRIKEIHDRTGDNDESVAIGLQRTGRIITSAALLIVVVFAGFGAGEVLSIKQLGVGLAIAVIVDATIVRSLLVPATMRLLGEWNWWAPAPLRRFHDRFGLHEAPSSPAAVPGSEDEPERVLA
ncbi:MAG: MMPL family transporter [Actinomycetota bacterium]|nr:MMPL family transporter [Actinomycetota bacterium]